MNPGISLYRTDGRQRVRHRVGKRFADVNVVDRVAYGGANTWKKIEDQIHSSFNKLMSELKKPGAPYVLSLANYLYGEQSYQFVEGSINDLTKLVLVNAIYFKGNWEKKFPKEATRDGQFKLNKLEKALTYKKLMEWTKPSKMLQEQAEVSLPRFKMEQTYDMKSLLISMGMEDVFLPQKVNLSGMSPNNDLVVSNVIHKAFVEVNEEGTEAAAATGVVIIGVTALKPEDPKTFFGDHPFHR
ncbi:hypothetical protein cypCar_00045284 [Cyprinus carpio]|nr:hypothetical protein cypCar_00045284 [Cyprinus carpio]